MNLGQLLARAERVFGGRSVADTVPPPVKAIIGPLRHDYEDKAQSALVKLRNAKRPNPDELRALEQVILAMRPSLLSKNGELKELPATLRKNAELHQAWEGFRARVRPQLYSVGRLEHRDDGSVATAFLVTEDLLATNRHVVDQLSLGTMVLEQGEIVVDFGVEWETVNTDMRFDVLACVAAHTDFDIALLQIAEQTKRRPFTLASGPVDIGDRVVTLGYPAPDKSRNPLFAAQLWGGPAVGAKRAAPGEVVGSRHSIIHHDCSTLGGNSGSPLFSMDTAEVVGIHQGGLFMYQNDAASSGVLAEFLNENAT